MDGGLATVVAVTFVEEAAEVAETSVPLVSRGESVSVQPASSRTNPTSAKEPIRLIRYELERKGCVERSTPVTLLRYPKGNA